jgi:hypothetical protein
MNGMDARSVGGVTANREEACQTVSVAGCYLCRVARV